MATREGRITVEKYVDPLAHLCDKVGCGEQAALHVAIESFVEEDTSTTAWLCLEHASQAWKMMVPSLGQFISDDERDFIVQDEAQMKALLFQIHVAETPQERMGHLADLTRMVFNLGKSYERLHPSREEIAL